MLGLTGFSRSAPDVLDRARTIATTDGSDTVEAEHLLLALTRQADEPTTRALDTLGITEAAVRAALESEVTDAPACCADSTSPRATSTPPCADPSRRPGQPAAGWGSRGQNSRGSAGSTPRSSS